MARRHLAKMRHSGVSIRLVPTALAADAVLKMRIPQNLPGMVASPSGFSGGLNDIAVNTVANAGGIILDVIGAMIFTKIFPRTPGLRLGRFRVSL